MSTPARKKGTKRKPVRRERRAAAAEKPLMGAPDIARALARIAAAIRREFPVPARLAVLGIRTRGVVLAERLVETLSKSYGVRIPMGVLDITLYRDDLSTLDHQPMVRDSEIPFDITGANLVLVDDVLFTGRTVRAAIDEIVDFGRPGLIRLAVLVDRGGHEYPIQADFAGAKFEARPEQFVRVHLDEVDGRDEVILLDRKAKTA